MPKLIPTPQEPKPKTNLTWLWILLVILILLMIATVIYLVYRKKKKAVANAVIEPTKSQATVQQEIAPVVTETEKPEAKKPEVTFDQSEVRESVTATEVDNIMSD